MSSKVKLDENLSIRAGTISNSMSEISFHIPDDALAAFHLPIDQVGGELRMAATMKLYELGRLSSGAAAKLAGVPRVEFLERLAEYGIDTFRLSREELESEARLG